jgi:hypothetical protein
MERCMIDSKYGSWDVHNHNKDFCNDSTYKKKKKRIESQNSRFNNLILNNKIKKNIKKVRLTLLSRDPQYEIVIKNYLKKPQK